MNFILIFFYIIFVQNGLVERVSGENSTRHCVGIFPAVLGKTNFFHFDLLCIFSTFVTIIIGLNILVVVTRTLMSVNKTLKERRNHYRLIRNTRLPRETFLFTDSKGADIKDHLPSSVSDNFHVIFKKGATSYDRAHLNSLLREINGIEEPIVLIWLGTCELTTKTGKYLKLNNYPYQTIEFTLTQYRKVKYRIHKTNPSAIVLFIECPYFSINRWNKHCNEINIKTEPGNTKRKRSLLVKTSFTSYKRNVKFITKVDQNLKLQIDYFNDHLKLVNGKTSCPRLSQDLIRSNKKKGDPKPIYRVNYNLLASDGVHPGRLLIKLWLYKMIFLCLENADWC